ncbi:hypothetical protein [Alteromonas sp. 009811495]|uniref:hypothetical protein n=1 Tax=Alteromonas sp. 009811495 TaxID=3002962 RepID=UPI00237EADB0|nr:hypothetical protein [Alteromonas sp. 009811495]WDT85987.1 hypothetical protein OZ660_18955 [Alteromonas sp. 009811495]
MAQYEVQGLGITTGRKRKKVYRASSEEEARQLAYKDGTEAESITELPPEPPTEMQLEYANGIGLKIPEGVTGAELSSLLTNEEERDKVATERHRKFAERYGVQFTKYTGKKTLFDSIQAHLTETGNERDMLSWFTYRIYRQLVKGKLNVPIESPDDAAIQSIVDELIEDDSIIKSVRRYNGRDLIWFGKWTTPDGYTVQGGSERTMAYKKAEELLKAKLDIVKPAATPAPKPNTSTRAKPKEVAKSETSGCLGTFLFIAAIPTSIALSSLVDLI